MLFPGSVVPLAMFYIYTLEYASFTYFNTILPFSFNRSWSVAIHPHFENSLSPTKHFHSELLQHLQCTNSTMRCTTLSISQTPVQECSTNCTNPCHLQVLSCETASQIARLDPLPELRSFTLLHCCIPCGSFF